MDSKAAICANSLGMHLNAARINYLITLGKTDNSAIEASYATMKQALADCDKDMVELSAMAESPEGKQKMAAVQKDYDDYKTVTATIIKKKLDNAFDFFEKALPGSPQLLLFVTELAGGFYSLEFIRNHDYKRFFEYNKSLLSGAGEEDGSVL